MAYCLLKFRSFHFQDWVWNRLHRSCLFLFRIRVCSMLCELRFMAIADCNAQLCVLHARKRARVVGNLNCAPLRDSRALRLYFWIARLVALTYAPHRDTLITIKIEFKVHILVYCERVTVIQMHLLSWATQFLGSAFVLFKLDAESGNTCGIYIVMLAI